MNTVNCYNALYARLETLTEGTMNPDDMVTEAGRNEAERLAAALSYLAKRSW